MVVYYIYYNKINLFLWHVICIHITYVLEFNNLKTLCDGMICNLFVKRTVFYQFILLRPILFFLSSFLFSSYLFNLFILFYFYPLLLFALFSLLNFSSFHLWCIILFPFSSVLVQSFYLLYF